MAEIAPTPAPEVVTPPIPQEAQKEEQVKAASQPESAAATIISSVKASAGKDGAKVIISGNGTITAKILKLDGNRIAINIPGAINKAQPNTIPVRKGGLVRVRIGQHPDKVSVVLDLTQPMDYTATPEGNSLVVVMNTAPKVARQQEKPIEESAVSQKQQAETSEKEGITPKESSAPIAPSPKQEVTPPIAEYKAEVPQKTKTAAKKEGSSIETPVYGEAESSFLTEAENSPVKEFLLSSRMLILVNVMRLFAEVADLNIILAPDVKGRVTVRMVNIPWD